MPSKTSSMILGLSLASTSLIAMSPSPAYAVDTKIYPGLACIRESGSGATPGQWAGGIINKHSTRSLHIRCPVTRDVVSRAIRGGGIRAMDRNGLPGQDVRCTFFSQRLNPGGGGHTRAFSPELRTAGDTGTNVVVRNFNNFTGFVRPESHYTFSCTIPPVRFGNFSMLSSYNVIENGQNE